MKIVADENIPLVREAFCAFGEVVTCSAQEISTETVSDAELLLVRSVTRVDEALLGKSAVRFVAAASIGFDNVDTAYLRERGIGFSNAPGSNADSVADYITAALLATARRRGFSLAGKVLGVVGVGNVGSRVVEKAQVLGMDTIQNDPPLERQTGEARFRPLAEVVENADLVTFHVPLTREGQDATLHMASRSLLGRMKPGSFIMNTARGPVVESNALLGGLKDGSVAGAVLDVWEGEPEISKELLGAADIGTSHIAGYSYDGKVNGTKIIREAAGRFLGDSRPWQVPELPAPARPLIEIDASGRPDEEVVGEAVAAAYDIEQDDRALRDTMDAARTERGALFDRLRKEYPTRRDFKSFQVEAGGAGPGALKMLRGLGFQLATGRA